MREVNLPKQLRIHPLNVVLRRGSSAERAFHKRIGRGQAGAIAGGLKPSPADDLIFHDGKTIPDLRFKNFYVAGDGWAPDDIANIDKSLGAAMADVNRTM